MSKKLYEYKLTLKDKEKLQEFRDEGLNEEEAYKLWTRWKCLTDLFFLGAEVLGLREARDRKTGRLRLDPSIHKVMAHHLESEEYTLQLWPRGHMKSAWMKIAIVQQVLKNPYVRIGLWTKTATLAKKELKAIANILAHPVLQYLFPDQIVERKKWQKDTIDGITVYREPADYMPQESQIEVWGVEGNVTGHHYDRHYYDDILNEKTIRTAEQIEKLEEWWQHVQSIKEINAVEKMIGTRYHYHDLYGRIIEEKYFDKVIVRKAIEGGKPIYSFFTMKALERLKKIQGEYIFSCQYLNEVVAMRDRIFIPPYPVFTHKLDKPSWYMTVDPASGRKYSDDTGICVAAVDKNQKGKCYFQEAYGINGLPNVVADEIVKKIEQYAPDRIGIETGLFTALKPLIDVKVQEREKETGMPLHRPIYLDIPTRVGNMSKAQKIARLLGASVRDGRVYFRPGLHELFHQMDFLNPNSDSNKDDIVDAASMMMMTIPHFSASRWWMSDVSYDYGFTLENYMKQVNNKGGRYSKLAV